MITDIVADLRREVDNVVAHDVYAQSDKIEISKLPADSVKIVVAYTSIAAETDVLSNPSPSRLTHNIVVGMEHRSMTDDEFVGTVLPAIRDVLGSHHFRFGEAGFDREQNGSLMVTMTFYRVDAGE